MVLSIFDQSCRDEDDNRVLRIDDSAYGEDADMEHILHRLTMAAADADIRHKMNVEDEYFSAIEKRDTEIIMRDQQLAEQKTQLAEQKTQLAEQEKMLQGMIKMLQDSGKPLDEIARALGRSIEDVRRLAPSQ
jgi:hypothetical protein